MIKAIIFDNTFDVDWTFCFILSKYRISMRLDDAEVASSRLVRGTRIIEAPVHGGLYLGGLDDHMTLQGMAGTRERLIGTIGDFVFDGKVMQVNQPVSFKGVGIGRA